MGKDIQQLEYHVLMVVDDGKMEGTGGREGERERERGREGGCAWCTVCVYSMRVQYACMSCSTHIHYRSGKYIMEIMKREI